MEGRGRGVQRGKKGLFHFITPSSSRRDRKKERVGKGGGAVCSKGFEGEKRKGKGGSSASRCNLFVGFAEREGRKKEIKRKPSFLVLLLAREKVERGGIVGR